VRIAEVLRDGVRSLEAARVPQARLTAEVLLAHVLETRREYLYGHPEDRAGPDSVHAYQTAVERRIRREPLQYITGRQEFYGRSFHVDPSVLIPRPETELVVETVLALPQTPTPSIIDVGTGSGCIASTLALELPAARVYATDVSSEAVVTARRNAARLGATVFLGCSDLLSAWRGPFEFVVSNPPYVALSESSGMQEEVVSHEPEIALFGTGDPMSLYRALIRQSEERLGPGGWLVLEVGYTMAASVQALFGTGWIQVGDRADLQGIPRVVIARRAPLTS
jgi:release factor glutamine methyltransferase